MTIRMRCPQCQQTVSVPPQLQGKSVRCPGCEAVFPAPAGAGDGAQTAQPGLEKFTELRPAAPQRTFADDDFEFSERSPRDYRPEQLPGGIRAIVASAMLGICLLLALAGAAQSFRELSLLDQIPGAGPPAQQLQNQIDENDTLGVIIGMLMVAALIATAIPFCMWMYRAHANLRFLNVKGLKYSPGWAAGAFFVPILNYFRPCQIAQEIWKASDPAAPRGNRHWWMTAPSSALIGFWWAAWIIGRILGYVETRLGMQNKNGDIDGLKATAMLGLGESLLTVVAAVFAIAVIWKIQSRQRAKLAALNVDPGDDLADEALK